MRKRLLFLVLKTSDFSIFMVCPHGQGGRVEPVRTYCGQRGGVQFFAILCGRLFGRPPYLKPCLSFFRNGVTSDMNGLFRFSVC